MTEKRNSSSLMEDLKTLNSLEDAQITPAFQAKWRAALPEKRQGSPMLRASLAAAAVILYLFGGTVV